MDLIKVNNDGQCTARELYEFLELNNAHFARWASSNIEGNGFAEEGIDYFPFTINGERGAQLSMNYRLTADFAKKLCMTSKSEKGEAARNYFIEVEKRFKAVHRTPQTYLEALKDLVATTEALELAAPKAQYFDKIVERGNLLNFRDTAKCLGIKQGEFMKFLETKYIYRDSKGKPKPYAEYVGTLFELKEYAGGVQCLVTVAGKQKFMEILSTERNSG